MVTEKTVYSFVVSFCWQIKLNCVLLRVDTLRDIGFPESFVNMVYQFISTSNMRVIWNDEALDSFSPSLGIRQGDPISPYLFVLCVECLFHLIHDVVDQNI